MKKGEMDMLRGKTAKMAVAALSALLVLSFTACGDTARKEAERQQEEEERLRADQERREQNRQAQAERKKILESPLFTSAQDYVLDVLAEASPDCEYMLSLDESGYYGAADETLAGVVDTADAARAFFDSESRLIIVGNWRDVYGDDPEPLLKALMEHGISGGLDGQPGGVVSCYTFDAGTGKVLFHPAVGV